MMVIQHLMFCGCCYTVDEILYFYADVAEIIMHIATLRNEASLLNYSCDGRCRLNVHNFGCDIFSRYLMMAPKSSIPKQERNLFIVVVKMTLQDFHSSSQVRTQSKVV